jgi:hypothetical protein
MEPGGVPSSETISVAVDGLLEYMSFGNLFGSLRFSLGLQAIFLPRLPVQPVLSGRVGLAFIGGDVLDTPDDASQPMGFPLELSAGVDLWPLPFLGLGLRAGWLWLPDTDRTIDWFRAGAQLLVRFDMPD